MMKDKGCGSLKKERLLPQRTNIIFGNGEALSRISAPYFSFIQRVCRQRVIASSAPATHFLYKALALYGDIFEEDCNI